jgi:hypothetical protein
MYKLVFTEEFKKVGNGGYYESKLFINDAEVPLCGNLPIGSLKQLMNALGLKYEIMDNRLVEIH